MLRRRKQKNLSVQILECKQRIRECIKNFDNEGANSNILKLNRLLTKFNESYNQEIKVLLNEILDKEQLTDENEQFKDNIE